MYTEKDCTATRRKKCSPEMYLTMGCWERYNVLHFYYLTWFLIKLQNWNFTSSVSKKPAGKVQILRQLSSANQKQCMQVYCFFACSEVKINLHVATVLHDGEGGNFFLTNMNMRQTLLVYIPNLNFLKIFLENQRP